MKAPNLPSFNPRRPSAQDGQARGLLPPLSFAGKKCGPSSSSSLSSTSLASGFLEIATARRSGSPNPDVGWWLRRPWTEMSAVPGLSDNPAAEQDWSERVESISRTTQLTDLDVIAAVGRSLRDVCGLARTRVDVASHGRLYAGIGAGWYEHEWRAYGYEWPELKDRMGAFREAVQIVHGMWTEDAFQFQVGDVPSHLDERPDDVATLT